MKYNFFLYNILIYLILYHIVFEFLDSYVYKFDVFTPLGRFVRKYFLHQKLSNQSKYDETFIFLFNLFISSILLYFANRWYGKEKNLKTFFKLIHTFIIINIPVVIYTFIDNGLSIFFVYLAYFLIPMSIMLLLILPIFWFNNKILGKAIVNSKK